MAKEKLPALQFYTGDWRKDPCVQALDHEHKGIWIDLLCIMNETERRGCLVLPSGEPMPDDAIARNLGLELERWLTVRSTLLQLGVSSENERGVMYNRRIVRDEKIRRAKARAGKKGGAASGHERRKRRGEQELTSEANAKQNANKREAEKVTSSVSVAAPARTRGIAPARARGLPDHESCKRLDEKELTSEANTQAKRGSSVAVAVAVSASAVEDKASSAAAAPRTTRAPARPPEAQTSDQPGTPSPDLAGYLGPHGAAVDRFTQGVKCLSPTWTLAVMGKYGPSGTLGQFWTGVPEKERPRILAAVLDSYHGEESETLRWPFFESILRRQVTEWHNRSVEPVANLERTRAAEEEERAGAERERAELLRWYGAQPRAKQEEITAAAEGRMTADLNGQAPRGLATSTLEAAYLLTEIRRHRTERAAGPQRVGGVPELAMPP